MGGRMRSATGAGRSSTGRGRRTPAVPLPDTLEVPLPLWGTLLRDMRRNRGLTQPQLAELAGLAQQSVSKIERGEACPHDQVKLKLAYALSVSPSTLFPWP